MLRERSQRLASSLEKEKKARAELEAQLSLSSQKPAAPQQGEITVLQRHLSALQLRFEEGSSGLEGMRQQQEHLSLSLQVTQ